MRFLLFGKHPGQTVGVGSFHQLRVVKEPAFRPPERTDNGTILSFFIRHCKKKLHGNMLATPYWKSRVDSKGLTEQ